MRAEVRKCELKFDYDIFTTVSAEAKELIKQMLRKDPNDRILAKSALNHKFFAEYNAMTAIQLKETYRLSQTYLIENITDQIYGRLKNLLTSSFSKSKLDNLKSRIR